MKRRQFITVLGGAAVWPVVTRAQQLPVVGILYGGTPDGLLNELNLFRSGLTKAGFIEGQNVAFESRMAANRLDQLPALADDLVRRRIAVIFSANSAAPALAAKAATKSIPIVFLMGADPVGIGAVASLAKPGGNITGVTLFAGELIGKRLELLHQLEPRAAKIAYIVNPTNPAFSESGLKKQSDRARSLGVDLVILNAASPSDIERVFTLLAEKKVRAMLVGPDTLFQVQRDQIVSLAARHAIPASYSGGEFVSAGGLFSYSADFLDLYDLAGGYVGRILKGEKPADLPVQQPTKFKLAINLKTAKALGLTVPPAILALANEVIE